MLTPETNKAGFKDLVDAIRFIESHVTSPGNGLPEDVFLFVSRCTPLVNVDLLIRNTEGQVLLTWRDDAIFGQGWHVPGGCIRLGETFAERISAVATGELGIGINFSHIPLSVTEHIDRSRTSRTHHVALLFECTLQDSPNPQIKYAEHSPKAGAWEWHSTCPSNLLQKEYCTWFARPSI